MWSKNVIPQQARADVGCVQQQHHKRQYPSTRHCLRIALGIFLIGDFLQLCLPIVRSSKSHTNGYVEIPFGPTVVIDGAISPGEWEGAGLVQIAIKAGWSANLFPLAQNPVVEFQISLSKLNANIKPESLVRIALDVTDTRQKWDLWPPGADLHKPNTWGEALMKAATHNRGESCLKA